MATKMCFLTSNENVFDEVIIEFEYIKGMAFSQKQKNVLSFHKYIQQKYPNKKILEVSTKSDNELGVKLSAFNLKLDGKYLECIFQSSKVFNDNRQYLQLLDYNPKDAKKFIQEETFGGLSKFRYKGIEFPLQPNTLFYDYIYISALIEVKDISQQIVEYDIFTDIEFNEKKQINCQARSCSIYSYMLKTNKVSYYMKSITNFKTLYKECIQNDLFSI